MNKQLKCILLVFLTAYCGLFAYCDDVLTDTNFSINEEFSKDFKVINDKVHFKNNEAVYSFLVSKAVNRHLGNEMRNITPLSSEALIKENIPENIYNELVNHAYFLIENGSFESGVRILGNCLRRNTDSDIIKKYVFTDNLNIQTKAIEALCFVGYPGASSLLHDRLFGANLSPEVEFSIIHTLFSSDYDAFRKASLRYISDPDSEDRIITSTLRLLAEDKSNAKIIEYFCAQKLNIDPSSNEVNADDSKMIRILLEFSYVNYNLIKDKEFIIESIINNEFYSMLSENIYLFGTLIIMNHGDDDAKKIVTKYFMSEGATEDQKRFFKNNFFGK
jgi:hypothetical protein